MKKHLILIFLIMIFLSSCSSSPSSPQASEMKLERYEGTIEVNDTGKKIAAVAGMNLFDGYGIETLKESYGWVDLDRVKLLKFDESSKVTINKNDRKLKISLQSGDLFFCVQEPLSEEEELKFETENMSLSIRGTTGVIKTRKNRSEVLLIEGEALIISKDGQEVSLSSQEKAVILTDTQGNMSITVDPIALGGDVPDHAIEEMKENDAVKAKLEEEAVFNDYMNEYEKETLIHRFFGTWRGRNYLDFGDMQNDYTWIISQGGGSVPNFWIRLSEESRLENRRLVEAAGPEVTLDVIMVPDTPAMPFVALKALDENSIDLGFGSYVALLSDNDATLTIIGEGKTVVWTRID